MKNKKLKKIMTDLAAGHISQEEADKLMDSKGSVNKKKASSHAQHTHKRSKTKKEVE